MNGHDEILEAIEPLAAGDLSLDDRIASHLAACPACAAALERARDVDRLLRARPRPAPPEQFTTRTLTRIRRARWRSEQLLDTGFNLFVLLLGALVVGGAWLLAYQSGLLAAADDAGNLMMTGVMTLIRRVAPSAPPYLAATALLASALGLWWWAEGDEIG